MNKISIELAANGYIVTEATPFTDVLAPPHVFESFDALVAHLRREFVGVPQNAQPAPPDSVGCDTATPPPFPSDYPYCTPCRGRCRAGAPVTRAADVLNGPY